MPSIKEIESLLDSKLQPIQAKLDDLGKQMNENYAALQKKITLLETRNVSLEAENATLTKRLQSCEISLNNLEQYSRRECVEISGIPEVEGENTDDIVIKVGSLIGLEITKNDISVSHRLPKPSYSAAVREGPQSSSNTSSRASNVIVKFVRRETRDHFYKGRKFLRDKSTRDLDLARYSENKIYISENLSQANKDLFKESLKVKKDLKYKFIWTFYGRTYLRKDSESPVVAILKKSDLDILKQDGGVHSANPNGYYISYLFVLYFFITYYDLYTYG